jgi:hypothetical protein
MTVDMEFSDGRVRARADGGPGVPEVPSAPAKPRSRQAGDKGQGSLFG